MAKSERKQFHEEFAEKIIKMLEEGAAPWQKPWTPGENLAPRNPITGTFYKGANRINLSLAGYEDPRWMTFNQASDAGYKIKKGSKSTQIVFATYTKQENKLDENGKIVLDEDGNPIKQTVLLERPIIKYSNVFHASQIEGIPEFDRESIKYEWEPQQKAEAILANSGAVIKHDQRDRNFYRFSEDEIHLTPKTSFDAPDKYYATALHELGHWTRHPTRLDRESGPFGSEAYAKEELRAEISSWMVGQDIGVGHDPGQHAAYVKSWIQALRDDPLEIVRACRDAEKIRDYVLGLEMQKEQQQSRQLAQAAEQETPAEQSMTLPAEPAPTKTYLNVPYKEKNLAKAHGAQWDREVKKWYCPEGNDLTPLKKWLESQERQIQQNLDPLQEFAQKLTEMGLDLKGQPPVMDGQIHRVPLLAKNGRGRDGAYCLHADGIPAGWVQNHMTGEKVTLVASGVRLSPAEMEKQRTERAARIQEQQQARDLEYDNAAARAQRLWDSFEPAGDHAYLRAKGVEAFGIRQVEVEAGKSRLVVPLRNIDGELRGYQTIDDDGQKRFFAGMEKRGNFCLLGDEGKDLSQTEIVICEGYATGASIHMATGAPVAVAFDAGNLKPVAQAIREKYPNAAITVCADNDHGKEQETGRNVGVEAARDAAHAVQGKVRIPIFTADEKQQGLSDFNDLHKSRGLDAAKKQLGMDVSKGFER